MPAAGRKKVTKRKCQWCEERKRDVIDGLCEECEECVVQCAICNSLQHEDGLCRHTFKDEHYCWNGAGCFGYWAHCKDSFLLLCSLMPRTWALDLWRAIRAGEFYTFTMRPLIGGGGSIQLGGLPSGWQNIHWRSHPTPEYGRLLVEIGESEHAEECADGWNWLQSLYCQKTPEANEQTLRWLMLAMGRRS